MGCYLVHIYIHTMICYLVHIIIHSYYGMLFSTQYTFILWAVLLHMHIRDGSLCFRSSPLFYSLVPLNLSYYSSTPLPLFLRLFHSQVQNSNCKLLCARLELSTSTDFHYDRTAYRATRLITRIQ